jgi:hypothetical protein
MVARGVRAGQPYSSPGYGSQLPPPPGYGSQPGMAWTHQRIESELMANRYALEQLSRAGTA